MNSDPFTDVFSRLAATFPEDVFLALANSNDPNMAVSPFILDYYMAAKKTSGPTAMACSPTISRR